MELNSKMRQRFEEQTEERDINWPLAQRIMKPDVYNYLRRMEHEFETQAEFIRFMDNYLMYIPKKKAVVVYDDEEEEINSKLF